MNAVPRILVAEDGFESATAKPGTTAARMGKLPLL